MDGTWDGEFILIGGVGENNTEPWGTNCPLCLRSIWEPLFVW